MALRTKKIVPILTDDDVVVKLCRIRDKALCDWETAVVDNGYKGVTKPYKAVRDSTDELIKILSTLRRDPEKISGEIRLKFMDIDDDEEKNNG